MDIVVVAVDIVVVAAVMVVDLADTQMDMVQTLDIVVAMDFMLLAMAATPEIITPGQTPAQDQAVVAASTIAHKEAGR